MKAKQCTLDSSMSKYGQIHVRIRPGTITMSLHQCRNEAKHSTLPWCLHQDKAWYQKHETESLLRQGHFHVTIMQDTIKMRPLPCQDTAMCTSQYRDPVHWKVAAPPWHKADSRPLTDLWIQYVTMKCIWAMSHNYTCGAHPMVCNIKFFLHLHISFLLVAIRKKNSILQGNEIRFLSRWDCLQNRIRPDTHLCDEVHVSMRLGTIITRLDRCEDKATFTLR